jgi:hypothetical protein
MYVIRVRFCEFHVFHFSHLARLPHGNRHFVSERRPGVRYNRPRKVGGFFVKGFRTRG